MNAIVLEYFIDYSILTLLSVCQAFESVTSLGPDPRSLSLIIDTIEYLSLSFNNTNAIILQYSCDYCYITLIPTEIAHLKVTT